MEPAGSFKVVLKSLMGFRFVPIRPNARLPNTFGVMSGLTYFAATME
jgi:hypothetical protein